MTGHYPWCSPSRCTTSGLPKAHGVHRSVLLTVRTHGGETTAHLYSYRNAEPSLILGGVAIPWSQVQHLMAVLGALTAPPLEVGGL